MSTHSTSGNEEAESEVSTFDSSSSEAADRLQSTLERVDDILLKSESPLPTSLAIPQAASQQQKLTNLAILGLGTYAMTTGMAQLLVQFEWFQTWRYVWPFGLGALFVLEGVLPIMTVSSSSIRNENADRNSTPIQHALPFRNYASWWQSAAVICGAGLVVGGAYDAFMPVWETGPNILTSAGIGQDSAAALLLLSIYAIVFEQDASGSEGEGDIGSDESGNSTERNASFSNMYLLLQMTLLGQLCVLAEGSTEEIMTRIGDILS
jgi:hypothetical protein